MTLIVFILSLMENNILTYIFVKIFVNFFKKLKELDKKSERNPCDSSDKY
jgi:hypothetical protein